MCKTKLDKNQAVYILKAQSENISCACQYYRTGGDEMSTETRTYNKDIKELKEQQTYEFGRISFIIEPRFHDNGNNTLVSVLARLLQNEDLSSNF